MQGTSRNVWWPLTLSIGSLFCKSSPKLRRLFICLRLPHRATFAVGGGLSKVQGNRHAFSLNDASISLPYSDNETISDTVLITVSVLGPAAIIGFVCLVF